MWGKSLPYGWTLERTSHGWCVERDGSRHQVCDIPCPWASAWALAVEWAERPENRPPDEQTMTNVSKGIKLTARHMGAKCSTLVSLAVFSAKAREAGIGPDGVLRTQRQAEVFLSLLRDWYRLAAKRQSMKRRTNDARR